MTDKEKPDDELDVQDTTPVEKPDETDPGVELELAENPPEPPRGEGVNPWQTISDSLKQSVDNLNNRLAALEADRQARQTAPEPEPEELEVETPAPEPEEQAEPPKSRRQSRRENRKRGLRWKKNQSG